MPPAPPTGRAADPVYLDHAATAPLRTEAAAAMAPWLAGPSNPSGSHRLARRAAAALDEARETVAALAGADPGEVVFTSGGTEADNLAVLGSLAASSRPGTVVCSAVEHPAVLEACRAAAAGRGPGSAAVELRLAPVDGRGVVDLDALGALLDEHVLLVTVMAANHETGAVQPLPEVHALAARRAPQAVVHTDAVQAAPWLDVRAQAAGAALIALSGHKLGGPVGTGALVVRRGTPLAPLLFGGGQERGRRSGTPDVAGAVGMAAAYLAASSGRVEAADRVARLRDRLADGLVAEVGGVEVSARRAPRLAGHCHVRVAGVDQEELLVLLDQAGVCASAGSACASGAVEPSHVLGAMGVGPAEARSAVRFTLGHETTAGEVDTAVRVVAEAVAKLRAG